MAKHRIACKLESGERFVETSPEQWATRLEAWKHDPTQPCPMPVGHLMFTHPKAYGAVLEDAPQTLELFAPALKGSTETA